MFRVSLGRSLCGLCGTRAPRVPFSSSSSVNAPPTNTNVSSSPFASIQRRQQDQSIPFVSTGSPPYRTGFPSDTDLSVEKYDLETSPLCDREMLVRHLYNQHFDVGIQSKRQREEGKDVFLPHDPRLGNFADAKHLSRHWERLGFRAPERFWEHVQKHLKCNHVEQYDSVCDTWSSATIMEYPTWTPELLDRLNTLHLNKSEFLRFMDAWAWIESHDQMPSGTQTIQTDRERAQECLQHVLEEQEQITCNTTFQLASRQPYLSLIVLNALVTRSLIRSNEDPSRLWPRVFAKFLKRPSQNTWVPLDANTMSLPWLCHGPRVSMKQVRRVHEQAQRWEKQMDLFLSLYPRQRRGPISPSSSSSSLSLSPPRSNIWTVDNRTWSLYLRLLDLPTQVRLSGLDLDVWRQRTFGYHTNGRILEVHPERLRALLQVHMHMREMCMTDWTPWFHNRPIQQMRSFSSSHINTNANTSANTNTNDSTNTNINTSMRRVRPLSAPFCRVRPYACWEDYERLQYTIEAMMIEMLDVEKRDSNRTEIRTYLQALFDVPFQHLADPFVFTDPSPFVITYRPTHLADTVSFYGEGRLALGNWTDCQHALFHDADAIVWRREDVERFRACLDMPPLDEGRS